MPVLCSLLDPCHIQTEWGNVLITRLSGDLYSPCLLPPPLTWKVPPRLNILVYHLSNTPRMWAGLPASQRPIMCPLPTSTMLKQTSRLFSPLVFPTTYDPKIVDVLVKPNQVSDELVKTIRDHILGHQVTKDFLNAVRGQTVRLESEMYKPLVRRSGYPCSQYSRSE